MPGILLVYYSRTGTTKKVAESISEILGCDSEEIIDMKKRGGIMGYIIAGKDAAQKNLTEIKQVKYNPADYETLIIGTPVRDFTMASAIRTYLTQYRKELPPKLIFFCTQGGGGNQSTFQEMAYICGKTPISTIYFSSKEVRSSEFMDRIKDFLSQNIKKQLPLLPII